MAKFLRLMRLALLWLGLASSSAWALQPNLTWYGNQDGSLPYNSSGACLSAQKSAWDARYPSHVSCRTYTDSPIVTENGNLVISSVLGGCAGGGVACSAPLANACPANSTLTQNASGDYTCKCAAGMRELNGQCTDLPPNCEAGSVWDDAAQACVVKPCAPDEVRVNGVCVKEPPCPAGQTRVNGKCEKDKCPKAGTSAGDGWEMSSAATEYACESTGVSHEGSVQYCMIKVVNTMDLSYGGKTFYYGRGTYTGAQCSGGTGGGDSPGSGDPGQGDPGNPDPGTGGPGTGPGTNPGTGPTPPDPDRPTPPAPPPVPPGPDNHCPAGTQRYSNGNCYAPTPPPTTPDSNGTCPQGSAKVGGSCVYPSPPGKPVPEPPNSDGTCPSGFHPVSNGAACVKDPEPPTGGTCPAGFTMVNGLCEFNSFPDPNDPGGGGDGDGDGKSGFAGDCKAGFACEGDAIQCAIAKEQHIMNCKLLDTEKSDPNYKAAADGTDSKSADKLRENAEQVNVSNFDSSGFGWSRACPPDPGFDVAGHTFSIPFSKVCGPLQVLSMASVGLTLLSCLMWVVGRGD